MAATKTINLTVNGQAYDFNIGSRPGQIDPAHTLVYSLRETLGLTGTKTACGQGACGACTVIMDGKPVNSCRILTVECDGKTITTIEGLRDEETGSLDPLQQYRGRRPRAAPPERCRPRRRDPAAPTL